MTSSARLLYQVQQLTLAAREHKAAQGRHRRAARDAMEHRARLVEQLRALGVEVAIK